MSGLALLALTGGSAFAAEGGTSFYLLGQRGQGAAIRPPVEGVFFALPNYVFSASVSGSQALDIGGAITTGLDADICVTMPTAIWVTPAEVLGGKLALSGRLVYGKGDLSADAAVSIPGVLSRSVSLADDRRALGDPVLSASLDWHGENYHSLVASSVNVPIGVSGYHYEQISGDSGAGATLGDFEGRVSAIGPGLSANFQMGKVPVAVSLRYFHEFNAQNRLEGDAGWLTVSIPLWVPGR